ncbi:hypothetical protein GCM10010841_33150 [Deinococcus aerophilus]|uniref:Uncharacterized protein n=1 Tax=Deinococcus aerophilus TaxID=522488 RepID=A0ABQ2H1U4_9DEIO|nr:hypothetical protein GCM10010841_33150 [Deinococcus aerophilus]
MSGAARRDDLETVARTTNTFNTCVCAWKQNQVSLYGLEEQFSEFTAFMMT